MGTASSQTASWISVSILFIFTTQAWAQTPENYRFNRDKQSPPPAARPVMTDKTPGGLVAKFQRPATPGSNINSFDYTSNPEMPVALNLRPSPKGCGFFSGVFAIKDCKRQQGANGYALRCVGFYTNPVTNRLTSWMPLSSQGAENSTSFEVSGPEVEAFLCSKTQEDKSKFSRTGDVIRTMAISKGMRVCDSTGKLYAGQNGRGVNTPRFREVMGPTLVDALKTQATDYIAKTGKTAEELLASCIASAPTPVAPAADAQMPKEPQRPVLSPLPIPRGGPNELEKPDSTKAAPKRTLPAPRPVTDEDGEPILRPKGRG